MAALFVLADDALHLGGFLQHLHLLAEQVAEARADRLAQAYFVFIERPELADALTDLGAAVNGLLQLRRRPFVVIDL